MSEFQVDWGDILKRLPLWRTLARDSRAEIARLPASEDRVTAAFGPDLKLLVDSRWAILSGDGVRLRLEQRVYPFARLVHSLARAPILSASEDCTLEQYLRTHLASDELMNIGGGRRGSWYGNRDETCAWLSSASCLQRFLDLKDARRYEEVRLKGIRFQPPPSLLDRGVVLSGAQDLLRTLMAEKEPLALERLAERWTADRQCTLGAALEPLLRYALALIDLDQELIPEVGLLPQTARRIHRPPPARPGVSHPIERMEGGIAVEDLVAFLLELFSEPARAKSGGRALSVRAEARLLKSFSVVPAWLEGSILTQAARPGLRISRALTLSQALGLASVRASPERVWHLQPTEEARTFLGQSAAERARRVLEPFRLDLLETALLRDPDILDAHDGDPNRQGSLGGLAYASWGQARIFPQSQFAISSLARVSIEGRSRRLPVRDALTTALASLDCERFVDWEEWLDFHARTANPFDSGPELLHEPGSFMPPSAIDQTDEVIEGAWKELLTLIASQVMFPFGGIDVGLDRGGRFSLRMTEVGRWLLGRATELPLAKEIDPRTAIVVQPNFDIVFLSSSPVHEATLARFAERRGRSVGTLFAITRESCLAAADKGLTAEQALETLRALSSRALPENVVHEMRGWFAQVRRVEMREAELIICPDVETMRRVLALGGTRVRRIGETAVEVLRGRAQLVRILREKGVFVGRANAPTDVPQEQWDPRSETASS